MILGPHNILKDMHKHKIPKYKPLKQNSIILLLKKLKRRKKSKENKTFMYKYRTIIIEKYVSKVF